MPFSHADIVALNAIAVRGTPSSTIVSNKCIAFCHMPHFSHADIALENLLYDTHQIVRNNINDFSQLVHAV
jgi:hypothetical protein